FEKGMVYEGPGEGTIAYAELYWPDGGGVLLYTAESEVNSVAGLSDVAATDDGYPAVSMHIDTDDPDALYARVTAAGAPIVRELADSPHGTRGFVARDPEGFHWHFGTPLPGRN
ncbi:MAG: VOC family protein, partial [Gemmatimonadota bacterium]